MRTETLILGRDEIARSISLAQYIDAVEQAFAMMYAGQMSVPDVLHIAGEKGGFHVKSAAYRESPAYVAVKINGNFPGNPEQRGLPTIQGVIVLCDARCGSVLAIMDSAEVTAMRTGAATAVAAKHLAPAGSRIATIIGCGVQARAQLRSLAEVLPIERVFAYDMDPKRSEALTRYFEEDGGPGFEILPIVDFSIGTLASHVIVTCTSAREAFLDSPHVPKGALVAAVGADSHDKQELSVRLLTRSRVVCDVLGQCEQIGELHHALAAGAMKRDDIVGELGEIVATHRRVRTHDDEVVVFDSTGCAIQDVAAAGIIYERAKATGIGTVKEFS